MPQHLQVVQMSSREGTTLQVVGDLDLESAGSLSAAIKQASVPDLPLVIDLAEVEFVDSSGLRALLEAREWSAQHNRRLLLSGLSAQVRRLLDLTQTTALFELVPNGDEEPAAPPTATWLG